MEEEQQTDTRAAVQQSLEARSFSPEFTGVLLYLARLARRAGAARSEQDIHDAATALLTCLLSLCAAQRGALLLVNAQPVSPASVSSLAQPAATPLRVLTCQGMDEHEVSALAPLLPAMPSDLSTIQGGPALPCWLLSHYQLDGSASSQPAQDHQDGMAERERLATQAYLLLGWDSMVCHPYTAAIEQYRMALSGLSDAIAAVLSSMQLAARILEMETQRDEAMHETDSLSSDLLAVVSHELRSPLTTIKGYATTLQRHAAHLSREERSQFLLTISEASDRLDQLIGRMLELARLENGSIPFTPVPVDPARMAQEALFSAEQRAARQAPDLFTFELRLQTEAGEEATSVPLIQADSWLLREALDTLLDNAVKYSPQGGVITVLLRPTTRERLPPSSGASGESVQPPPAALLEICVRDLGIGIPAGQIERVFERFYQVDRGLTREAGGVGLGLTICKHIVELHHGRIWVESRPGEGSTFHLVVPISQPAPL